MKKHYYVMRIPADLSSSGLRLKHATLASAQAEALRLLAKQPGDTFEIVAVVAVAHMSVPTVTKTK
jgi:hypothetical protein